MARHRHERKCGTITFHLDVPVHRSQREIGHGEDFADFELFLRPTVDFCGHILSRGSQLKVLSPKWLADEIYDMHKEAARMYDTEEDNGE